MSSLIERPQLTWLQIATECLQLIFSRQFREDKDFEKVFSPVLHPSTVQLLSQIFELTQVDPDAIDDEAYTFLQKFSEVIRLQ